MKIRSTHLYSAFAAIAAAAFSASACYAVEPAVQPVDRPIALASAQAFTSTLRSSSHTPRLKAGVQFNKTILDCMEGQTRWYRIPHWLAGSWRREWITITSLTDYRARTESNTPTTETAKSVDDEGWQMDSRGQLWSCSFLPSVSVTESDTEKQIFLIEFMQPLSVSRDLVVKEFAGTALRVDKKTGIVLDVVRAESVKSYRPVGADIMVCHSTVKEFDRMGRVTQATRSYAVYKRMSGFRPRNRHSGRDMRAAFESFLVSSGRADLVRSTTED